jgi:hypothetical protein
MRFQNLATVPLVSSIAFNSLRCHSPYVPFLIPVRATLINTTRVLRSQIDVYAIHVWHPSGMWLLLQD